VNGGTDRPVLGRVAAPALVASGKTLEEVDDTGDVSVLDVAAVAAQVAVPRTRRDRELRAFAKALLLRFGRVCSVHGPLVPNQWDIQLAVEDLIEQAMPR
jgi:hypothetical protein